MIKIICCVKIQYQSCILVDFGISSILLYCFFLGRCKAFEYKQLDLNSDEAIELSLAIFCNVDDIDVSKKWEKKAIWKTVCKEKQDIFKFVEKF